jgi:hypothetical protein
MAWMIEERLVSRALDRLERMIVIYTDLDGTMVGPGGSFLHAPDKTLTTEPVEALMAAHRAELDVVPVSGRALRGLQTDARLLGMSTVIAEMGALVSYEHGRDVVHNFGESPRPGLPAAIMEEDGAVAKLLERYAGKLEHHTPWSGWRECTQLFRGRVDTDEVDAWLASTGYGWLRLWDNGRLHGSYLDIEPGDARAYHLMPRGVSKGSAVAIDRERRGFARTETIAVGDAEADLELAPHVGWFVMVRDALDADPVLAERCMAIDNVLVTDRPHNLGWADLVSAIARVR